MGALWVALGLGGILLSLLLSVPLIRREIRGLSTGSSARVARLTACNLLNLVILLSVVWAMVAKPA